MILGNLYREKGQVGRAIQIHQQILQRPRISRLEHTHVLLCLGLDYRRGGFVDRATRRSAKCCGSIRATSTRWLQLQKLYEDQNQWTEAVRVRERLAETDAPGRQPRHRTIRAFLENELGLQALTGATSPAAASTSTRPSNSMRRWRRPTSISATSG